MTKNRIAIKRWLLIFPAIYALIPLTGMAASVGDACAIAPTGYYGACSCALPLPQQYAKQAPSAKAVFLGKVTRIETLPPEIADIASKRCELPLRVHFHLSKAWKGVDTQDVIVKTWKDNTTNCIGYPFEAGATYLVVTEKNALRVDHLCGLTLRMNPQSMVMDNKDIGALGKPEKVFGSSKP